MPAALSIDNFSSANLREKTILELEAVANDTSLTVRSSAGFAVDEFVLVGGVAVEGVELRRVTGVVIPGLLSVPAVSRPHNRFSEVQALAFDKKVVYRAPDVDGSLPLDATFAEIGETDMDIDSLQTLFIDPTGGATFWYKFTDRNSITAAETSLTDGEAARGSNEQRYCSISDIREEAGFSGNENIPDRTVDRHRRYAESEIDSVLRSAFDIPFAEVPTLVEHICISLAAGFMLSNEYVTFENYQTDRGSGRRKEARAMLERIKSGDLDLFEPDGDQVTEVEGVRGTPDHTAEPPVFTMDRRY